LVSAPTTAENAFTISILAAGVNDLYAIQVDISFNPSLLSAQSVVEGSFLRTGGSTIFFPGTVDNVTGKVSFITGLLSGPVTGVGGSGTIATVQFVPKGAGINAFALSNVIALDSSLGNIAVNIQGASTRIISAVSIVPAVGQVGITLLAILLASVAVWTGVRSGRTLV
jgi:hypothetical protein